MWLRLLNDVVMELMYFVYFNELGLDNKNEEKSARVLELKRYTCVGIKIISVKYFPLLDMVNSWFFSYCKYKIF